VATEGVLVGRGDAADPEAMPRKVLSKWCGGAGRFCTACLTKFVSRDHETIFVSAKEAWWFFSEAPTCSKNALRTEMTKPTKKQ
jgi:hypothetical protein